MKKLYVSEHRAPGGNEKTAELKALFDQIRAMRPAVRFLPEKDPFPADRRIRALSFTGLKYGDHENTVFAYIGFPETASPASPVPGMVLVHGGGGHAYAEWVQYWTDRGYAAISFDGFGQTYVGAEGTYEADLDYWKPDPAHRLPFDGFAAAGKPFLEQGFTYYVADVLLAHSVLRADPRVDKTKVGLTGISWGGIAAGIAVALDGRFAFAAPVYGSGFMNVLHTCWRDLFIDKDLVTVWDARFLLDTVSAPVRFFNGDADPFFAADASTAAAAAAPFGSLTLLPGFTHGQIEGAAIPELARFADAQVGRGDRNIRIDALYADGDGALLSFSLPDDVKTAEACVYYKTEGFVYEGQALREPWRRVPAEIAGGQARLPIPENAQVFYFCVSGGTPAGQTLHATSGVFTRRSWENAR